MQVSIYRYHPCSFPHLSFPHQSSSPHQCRRNPDAWSEPESFLEPYAFTLPVHSDSELVSSLANEAGQTMGSGNVVQGLNATADSFYSSQVGQSSTLQYTSQVQGGVAEFIRGAV